MDLSRHALEQFVVLAEELHVGRAAQRLQMTQPPLSQALQRLERALAVRLFDREARGLRLTPAGTVFLADTRALLRMQQAAVDRARRTARGEVGEIHVGFVSGMIYRAVPRLLSAVSEHLPGLRIHLHQAATPQLVEGIRTGEIDLGLGRYPAGDTTGLEMVALAPERLALAVNERNPLAQRSSVRLGDVAQSDWVMLAIAGFDSLAEQVAKDCRRAGFSPNVTRRADTLDGLLAQVRAADAVSLVPESVMDQPPSGVVVVPLDDEGPDGMRLTSYAISRSGRTDPLVLRLRALLVDEVFR